MTPLEQQRNKNRGLCEEMAKALASVGRQLTFPPASASLVQFLVECFVGVPGSEEHNAFMLAYEQRMGEAFEEDLKSIAAFVAGQEAEIRKAQLLEGQGVPAPKLRVANGSRG